MTFPRFRLRLKTLLIAAFLSLGILLAVGYSMLTADYMIRGMDVVLSRDMEATVRHLAQRGMLRSGPFGGYYLADEWEDLPESIRQHFDKQPKGKGTIHKAEVKDVTGRPEMLYFVMIYPVSKRFTERDFGRFGGDPSQFGGDERDRDADRNGDRDGDRNGDKGGERDKDRSAERKDDKNVWYIATTFRRPHERSIVSHQLEDSRRDIWIVGGASIAIVLLIAFLLYSLVARPAGRLVNWTRKLDSHDLKQPVPDFGYTELNELASLVHGSVCRMHETLEREKAFLRFASHELRTPIAVVRNNTELLSKMAARGIDLHDDRVVATLHRLERAGITMSQLTETLLWLSRDDISQLPRKQLSPGLLARQLTEELAFLLNNKQVEVVVEVDDNWTAEFPATPLRIVLGNLIRNAFQHTWEGRVEIRQQGGTIHIDNFEQPTADSDSQDDIEEQKQDRGDQGFGLGLQLTQQLTDRLGWRYSNQAEQDGHRVCLVLDASE